MYTYMHTAMCGGIRRWTYIITRPWLFVLFSKRLVCVSNPSRFDPFRPGIQAILLKWGAEGRMDTLQ